jgi:YVTN family beta-propeller protein
MKTSRILSVIVFFSVLGLIIFIPGRKWARGHVNFQTAVEDHPLNCLSCHLHNQKTGIISKLVNRKYLSPFNLAVSKDGDRLYVIAQEANSLLVVDVQRQKVINKIPVGNSPHSVILSNDEKQAYVSNQWSDNVSVIDLNALKVVDTLKTGNGPAGLSLSSDNKALFVVNSYSSSISVLDLNTGEERKRFDAGNNPTGVQLSPDGKTLIVTSRRALIAP